MTLGIIAEWGFFFCLFVLYEDGFRDVCLTFFCACVYYCVHCFICISLWEWIVVICMCLFIAMYNVEHLNINVVCCCWQKISYIFCQGFIYILKWLFEIMKCEHLFLNYKFWVNIAFICFDIMKICFYHLNLTCFSLLSTEGVFSWGGDAVCSRNLRLWFIS